MKKPLNERTRSLRAQGRAVLILAAVLATLLGLAQVFYSTWWADLKATF